MYTFGIIAGVLVGLVAGILIIRLVRKATHQKGTWAKYDERQQAARGNAYKYAFFTVVILNAVAFCYYSSSDEITSLIPIRMVFLGILLTGLLVHISYAIWNNAYLGLNETFGSTVIMFVFVSIVNLAVGILNLREFGTSEAYLNLIIGAWMAVICVEMIAKHQNDKQDNEDSEE